MGVGKNNYRKEFGDNLDGDSSCLGKSGEHVEYNYELDGDGDIMGLNLLQFLGIQDGIVGNRRG